MTASNDTPLPETGDPIGGFARCHEAITDRLDTLGGLPPLVEAAARARRIALEALQFFDAAIVPHHEEEERELIPAVRQSAVPGEESRHVEAVAQRLVAEHRRLEALWAKLKPRLKLVAAGRDASVDARCMEELVAGYKAHAAFEETEFLPLAETILGRRSRDLAALGLSLHIRHAKKAISPYI